MFEVEKVLQILSGADVVGNLTLADRGRGIKQFYQFLVEVGSLLATFLASSRIRIAKRPIFCAFVTLH